MSDMPTKPKPRFLRFSLRAMLLLVFLSCGCNHNGADKASVSPSAATSDEALNELDEAIRLNPNSADAFWNRANAYSKQDRLVEAIKDFTEAIRLAPDAAGAYNARGVAKLVQHEYDSAIEDFTEAIRIDAGFVLPYGNRGWAWELKGDDGKALADYNNAIRIDPNHATAYFQRGCLWLKTCSYDKATSDFEDAIQGDPAYALAYIKLAWLQATCPKARFRDGTKAIKNATKACELASWTFFTDVDTLAAAYAEAGDFDSAIKYQQKAIDLNPNDAIFVKRAKQRLALYKKHKPYRDE